MTKKTEPKKKRLTKKEKETIKREKDRKMIQCICNNYKNLEGSIASQLNMEVTSHNLTTGINRERVWLELFKQIIPKKFSIDQGVFIIDSFGQISNEIDIAIFDETYTPYIFNYGVIKFIPIEAVAVVVECKSKSLPISNLKAWTHSIDVLKTSLDSVYRIVTDVIQNDKGMPKTQTATRPIKIFCGLLEENDKENLVKKKLFDIHLFSKGKDIEKVIGEEEKDNFVTWYEKLNHSIDKYGKKSDLYKTYCKLKKSISKKAGKKEEEALEDRTLKQLSVINKKGEENVILSLTMQLNQLLMLINNPIPFPHRAYTQMFNKNLEDDKGEKTNERT